MKPIMWIAKKIGEAVLTLGMERPALFVGDAEEGEATLSESQVIARKMVAGRFERVACLVRPPKRGRQNNPHIAVYSYVML